MVEAQERGRTSSGRAIRRGDIPSDGVLGVLREIEGLHVTGVLRFVIGAQAGTIALERGQIASEQDESAGDPLELFLAARKGRYEVLQILPPLEGSSGDTERRTGAIGEHAVADLMAYCERAGLTGVLTMERAGVRAEAVYDRGELTGLVVDGTPDDGVDDVFAWSEGLYSVTAHVEAPELPDAAPVETPSAEVKDTIPAPPPAMRADTTQTRLLRVVEMSLADVLRKREERRPSVRPPGEPSPEEGRREATVRVVFLGSNGEAIVERPRRRDERDTHDDAGAPRDESMRISQEGRRASAQLTDPPAALPRAAIAALVLLLLAGLAAFVVTLMRLG